MFPVTVAIMAAVVTASAAASGFASLDVSRTIGGEVWRLFTGHLAHVTWRQYAIDAPAFVFLYASYCRRAGFLSAFLLSLFAALSVSSAVILAGMHQVYGGLSGLSCAAVSALLVGMIMDHPRRAAPYAMCFIYGAYLLFMGGITSGVRVAQEAHAAGAIAGTVFVLTAPLFQRFYEKMHRLCCVFFITHLL